MKRFLLLVVISTWLMAACMAVQPADPQGVGAPVTTPAVPEDAVPEEGTPDVTPEIPDAATPVATPEPDDADIDADADTAEADAPADMAAFEDSIQQFAASELGVDAANISIVEIEAVEWPDACLGAAEPDEFCAMVITPGYRVVAQIGAGADAETHVFHTNQDASTIRLAEEG